MPLWDVLKKINLNGEVKLLGDTVELDMRRGNWLRDQHQAVRLRGAPDLVPPATAALVKPKPPVRRCCGQ